MSTSRRRTVVVIVVGALAGIGTGIAIGLDEDEPEIFFPTVVSTGTDATSPAPGKTGDENAKRSREPDEPNLPPTENDPEGLEPGPSGPAPESTDEIAAADAARAYVEAIDARNGRDVCNAFEPGAEGPDERLALPEEHGSCDAAFDASFGFEGKDGQPVWASSEMTQDVSVQIDGDFARVVATVFTKYADVREPTIEDDIIYLSRATDRWLVIQPSATLYRAVGIA
ncbi:MAG: hypothetical protein M3355_06615, partial [Actinomycetota bacterium]|nr:hypothetical protein [Actinomycetota bacterium]